MRHRRIGIVRERVVRAPVSAHIFDAGDSRTGIRGRGR
jgi:hypothetical protein